FILDRTLEPALAERPLDGFKLIDPACGSGHFLLGTFVRLLDRWQRGAPGMETQARVQAALDAVHGVDLNPFSIAIARFRLTVAALQACGLTSLEKAPAFGYHLGVGDSLIHGPDTDTLPGMESRAAFMQFNYQTEDAGLLRQLLEEGRYDVVVGNPPYITVKDNALNQIYRQKYADVCKGKYALSVPFMKLFFVLAKPGARPGWTGMITSNSFMKREFGSKVIEDFLAHRDLRLVADTSGAYIPGHGTPTVIIVGRNQGLVGSTVGAVLGVRGEPGRPDDPAKGIVWTDITEHVDQPGWDDGWITVTDLDHKLLATHPWSLTGGGAVQLTEAIESAARRDLASAIVGKIGFASFPGSDDAFLAPRSALRAVPDGLARPVISGDVVRDWHVRDGDWALVPYNRHDAKLLPLDNDGWGRRQWPYRTVLGAVTGFGGQTRADADEPWWGWYRWVAERYLTPLSIAFAFVATHNQFVMDRGGKVFKQSAPVIKLPAGATEDDHLALLGVLNSSTACFWLKQNSHDKGIRGEGGGFTPSDWERFYEFTGTTLQDCPLPKVRPLKRGRLLDDLASEMAARGPGAVAERATPTFDSLAAARTKSDRIRRQMIAVQEELDWEVYRLYGLVDEDLTYSGLDLPGIALGERAFEIVLARAVEAGEEETAWFSRHGSTPITEIPAHWPADYRDLVQRRLDVIASNSFIRLLEKPEYKRRWATEPWDKRQDRALRDWLLDRLEDRKFWFDPQGRPLPRSIGQLADEVARDREMTAVLALWEGRPDLPAAKSLTRLLGDQCVPYLAGYRYKEPGMRKRLAWEETWDLQRREDAGQQVGPIAVPPKYTSADFSKQSYWAARGKLDVPKERFILYPEAGRDTDPTLVLGWAGWDHAQQSLALSIIIGEREKDGWADERLVPLVAGLAELQPWVQQWHADVDPAYGVSMAAFCGAQLTAKAAQVGKTLGELAAWRPAAAARGRRPGGGTTGSSDRAG
ncbi:MAG: BREX-2 system adenine-specific DNA-methyltransferase PglX, partial [Streptosporangiaceae bacterium]